MGSMGMSKVPYLPTIAQTPKQRKIYLKLRNIFYKLTGYSGFGIYTSAGHIHYGKGVSVAPGVKIISRNHNLYNTWEHEDYKDVYIGDYCWIGANAVILPGVTLGPHTIVGAGAIVTKSFPDGYCVIAGNPAKLIKKITEEEGRR